MQPSYFSGVGVGVGSAQSLGVPIHPHLHATRASDQKVFLGGGREWARVGEWTESGRRVGVPERRRRKKGPDRLGGPGIPPITAATSRMRQVDGPGQKSIAAPLFSLSFSLSFGRARH